MEPRETEKYHSAGSRWLGWVGIALGALLIASLPSGGLTGGEVVTLGVVLFLGVLLWAALIRPQVRLTGDQLTLRNMLDTVTVPVAAVEDAAVRRVLVLRVAGQRLVSSAVSKSMRQIRADNRGEKRDATAYANFVEDRIKARAEETRAQRGLVRGEVPADVRREPAWAIVGVLAACLVVVAVGLAL